MNAGIYKRYFEVRVLHEYHLSDRQSGGGLFFGATPLSRQQRLPNLIRDRKIDIQQYLTFEPTPSTVRLLKNLRLRFWLHATGFTVAGEVKPNGASFQPAIPFPKDISLNFYIRAIDRKFPALTALRMRPESLSSLYFFSNQEKPDTQQAMVNLANAVAPVIPARTYEPGELALFNNGLHEAFIRTTGQPSADWTPVSGDGYGGEQDRILTGNLIQYQWNDLPGHGTFTLSKLGVDFLEVKKIEKDIRKTGEWVTLDFRRQLPRPDGRPGKAIESGFYHLEILQPSGSFMKRIYLHNEIATGNPALTLPGITALPKGMIGMVQIVANTADPVAPYLNNDGTLRVSLLPDGSPSHPIYEIRWLNRSLKWRYRSDRGMELNALGVAANHLSKTGKDLVTNAVQRFHFQQMVIATGVNIPTPGPEQLYFDPDSGQFFGQVLIHRIRNLIDSV